MGENKGKKHKKKVTEVLHDYEEIEYFTPEIKNSKKSDPSENPENDVFSKPDNFKTNIVNVNKSDNFDSIVKQIDRVIKSNDYEDVKKANYFESLDIALKVLNDLR